MKRAAYIACAASLLGLIAGMVALPADAPFIAGWAAYPVVGFMILRHVPRHRVGSLMLAAGIGWGAAGAASWLIGFTGPTGDAWLSLLQQTAIVPGYAFVLLAFALFPDGRAIRRHQRALAWFICVVAALGVTVAVASPVVGDGAVAASPLALGSPNQAWQALGSVFWWGTFASLILVAASLVARFRTTEGIERLQYRWFVFGVLVMSAIFAVSSVVPIPGMPWALWAPPAAIGVAIARYRLFEIDRIVSRTVSYAVVTGVVLGTYGLVVTSVSRLLPDSGALPVAGATLVAAGVFRPVLRRVRGWVDRRFDRARFDGARAAEAFAGRLASAVDPDEVAADLVATVRATLAPRSVGVWLAGGR